MSIQLGKYRHYKNKNYEVIGEGIHSETGENFVIYKALYELPNQPKGQLRIRPKEMFEEFVEVYGRKVKRFEFIGT